jgi:hypothetical protein
MHSSRKRKTDIKYKKKYVIRHEPGKASSAVGGLSTQSWWCAGAEALSIDIKCAAVSASKKASHHFSNPFFWGSQRKKKILNRSWFD